MGGVSVRVTAVAGQRRERTTPTVIIIGDGIPTTDGEAFSNCIYTLRSAPYLATLLCNDENAGNPPALTAGFAENNASRALRREAHMTMQTGTDARSNSKTAMITRP